MDIGNIDQNYLVEIRRHLHKHPELSLCEEQTSVLIQRELARHGISFSVVAGTGVVAEIGRTEGKCVLLRADMDALPVKECTQVAYTSVNDGVMHACGHDAHTAMLLGAAIELKRIEKELQGKVRLVFQPAEETGEATNKMIDVGMLQDVDTVFALHVAPDLPVGTISAEAGPRMAGVDDFDVVLTGAGGHGAMPHLGTDALLTVAHLVVNLQEYVSREVNPLDAVVVTVGKLDAGQRRNILASEAKLSGNIRFFNKKYRDDFRRALERITKGTADMYRVNAEVHYIASLLPCVNDEECASVAQRAVKTVLGEEGLIHKDMATTSEDFSRYLDKVPGVLAFLGTWDGTPSTNYPLHHECFDIGERALSIGAAMHVAYAMEYLKL